MPNVHWCDADCLIKLRGYTMSDTPSTADVTLVETMNAVSALREEVKNLRPDQEKLDKINEYLDLQEIINQKSVKDMADSEKTAQEQKEQIEGLEAHLARVTPIGGEKHTQTPEYKALESWVKHGDLRVAEEHKVLLRTDQDSAGGYLAPVEMDNVIIKKITEFSDLRSLARVRTTATKSRSMPKRTTIPTATYEGEADVGADSSSTYDTETIVTYRQTFTTPITLDLLMDAQFDMEAEILSDAGESFALGEGNGFIVGTGVKQPQGILVDPTVVAAARTSTTSATVDPEDVILLTGDLKVGYQPWYVFNRKTLAFIRTLTATTGAFLWMPGLNGPVANTLNGFSYLVAQDMPDIAANSLSIAFGDFFKGYTITDRTGFSVIRDDVTLKRKATVEFTLHRWNTGQVVLPEAIQLLKTKA